MNTQQETITWIPVEDYLPMFEWKGERVIDEYLVTVRYNHFEDDPNTDDEICLMTFCSFRMCFMINFNTDPDPLPYEDYNTDWHIVAWAEKPKPYGK